MIMNDHQTQAEVMDALRGEPALDASRIFVAARDGVVSLSGVVNSREEKQLAEQAAKRVAGVHAVGDELHVQLPHAGERPDTAIAEASLCCLRTALQRSVDRIQVTVDDGWITLEGVVDSTSQRTLAETAVQNLTGVLGVRNLIRVAQPA
jgi:osmotically-inducible protein OsmY